MGAIDDALETLAKVDERKSRVVELRFFGGLSVEETAEVFKVSSDTVMRDWRLARHNRVDADHNLRKNGARGSGKESLAKQLGVHQYIDSQAQDAAAELSKLGGAKIILATVTNAEAMSATLGGLSVNGKLLILGAPHEPLVVPAGLLIAGRRSVAGWYSGTSIDSQDTLTFSLLTGVRAMTEVFPLERAAEAYERMMSGKARFRVVLIT